MFYVQMRFMEPGPQKHQSHKKYFSDNSCKLSLKYFALFLNHSIFIILSVFWMLKYITDTKTRRTKDFDHMQLPFFSDQKCSTLDTYSRINSSLNNFKTLLNLFILEKNTFTDRKLLYLLLFNFTKKVQSCTLLILE